MTALSPSTHCYAAAVFAVSMALTAQVLSVSYLAIGATPAANSLYTQAWIRPGGFLAARGLVVSALQSYLAVSHVTCLHPRTAAAALSTALGQAHSLAHISKFTKALSTLHVKASLISHVYTTAARQ